MPITELPAELLVRIFRELRDMHIQSYSNGWLPITHVCRDWRLVALDAAELWTQIYSVDPDCVQTFLMRSKSAPLDLCYPKQNSRCFRSHTVLPMLLSDSSRFRRVALVGSGAVYQTLVYPFPGGTPLPSTPDLDVYLTHHSLVGELPNVTARICQCERRAHNRADPGDLEAALRAAVVPLASAGCSADACICKNDDGKRCIEGLVSAE